MSGIPMFLIIYIIIHKSGMTCEGISEGVTFVKSVNVCIRKSAT